MSAYPKATVTNAIAALELSHSYLRDKPVTEEAISDALNRLYRLREIEEGIPHPYAGSGSEEVSG